jgi:acyl-CoA synthetase (AMP-forming)/AMP-acid ligase II
MISAEALPHVFPTVVHMLADTCSRFPKATALVCGERSLRYDEYARSVAGFTAELIRHGARGSRVALVCANSPDMPIAMFGVHCASAQAVPINPTYTQLAHPLDLQAETRRQFRVSLESRQPSTSKSFLFSGVAMTVNARSNMRYDCLCPDIWGEFGGQVVR